MDVISIRKAKKGWNLKVEMTPREHDIMFVAGLRLYLKEIKAKVVVVTIAEANRLGLKKSDMKSVNLSKEEADIFVEMACKEALKRGVKKGWKPGKCKRK